MYISNADKLKNTYVCTKTYARYLMSCDIPYVYREGNTYTFVITPALKEALDNMPFLIKLLGRW